MRSSRKEGSCRALARHQPDGIAGDKLIQVVANRPPPNYNGNRNPLPRLDFAPMIENLAWYVHRLGCCGLIAERRIAGGPSLDKSRRNKGSLQLKLPKKAQGDAIMKRWMLAGALLGTLIFAAAAPASARPYYYRRPVARAAARVALPPYGYARPYYGRPYYGYGPRFYGGPGVYGGARFYGPSFGYGYRSYGPGAYVGLGVF
jgi:hypothetical protein